MQSFAVFSALLTAVGQAVLAGHFVHKKKYGWATTAGLLSIISMMMYCTILIQGAIL